MADQTQVTWADVSEEEIRKELAYWQRRGAHTIWLVPCRYDDGQPTCSGSQGMPFSNPERRFYRLHQHWVQEQLKEAAMLKNLVYCYQPKDEKKDEETIEVPREVQERALGIIWPYVYRPRCHWPSDDWFGMEFDSLWDLNLWKEGINRYATIYPVFENLQTDTSHFFRLLTITPVRNCRVAGATIEEYVRAIRRLGPVATGRTDSAFDSRRR